MSPSARTVAAGLGCRHRIDEPLSRHTSFRIGGPAELMAFPGTETELSAVLRLARAAGLPYLVLGNGTNLLVGDRGYRGVVIKLTQEFRRAERSGSEVTVGAGSSLPRLVAFCLEQGLAGMEWAVGIPGSVGGALVMNAGAYGGQMSDVVAEVWGLLPGGRRRVIPARLIRFGYRQARYPDGFVITGCRLRLRPGRRQTIRSAMAGWLAKRARNQPLTVPSAGCVFKNPANDSARRLIGLAGMRGKCVGGAQVSAKHANFIVNRGGATAADVLALARRVRAAVDRELGVRLVPEIKLVGER